jgi:hypothetical protein
MSHLALRRHLESALSPSGGHACHQIYRDIEPEDPCMSQQFGDPS